MVRNRYNDHELEKLKRNVSILHVCAAHGIELKGHGTGDYVGRCPFHEEDEPSFIVTPSKNLFHCMGCDAGGSVIDLVMKLDGLTFREAVDKLMTSNGLISRGADAASASASAAARLKKQKDDTPAVSPARAAQLLERVAAIYEKNLPESPEALEYLKRRGLDNTEQLTAHRAGYANGRLHEILPQSGKVLDELKALGVLSKSGHESSGGGLPREHFAGCVVFPVTDVDGNIVTLYGRHVGDGLKRHVFLPKRHTGLWNAPVLKTYPEIIAVESVLDALSVEAAGFPNVVAIQGTNGLHDGDIADMLRFGVGRVILMLDGDKAGAEACEKIERRIKTHPAFADLSTEASAKEEAPAGKPDLDAGATPVGVALRILPDDHDPNSFLVAFGKEKLSELILCERGVLPETFGERASPEGKADALRDEGQTEPSPLACSELGRGASSPAQMLDGDGAFTVSCGARHYRLMGLDKGQRKLKVTVRVEHAGRLHVDTLDLYSARSRRNLEQDLCRLFSSGGGPCGEATPEIIEADITKLVKRCEAVRVTAEADPAAAPVLTAKEKDEAAAFGKRPDLLDAILADYETCGLVGEEPNKLLGYLAAVSRKMPEPLSILILSSSGAGKTALQDAACGFVPPEDLVKLTSLSGKALFYKDRMSLKHKVLALEEGAGAEDASYAIRNLISAGELVVEAAMKDPTTGRITTMTNRVEGPTAVLMTTTNPEIDPETKSRFIVTSADESREQTRAILSFQRRREGLDGLFTSRAAEDTLKRHHNFQRLLRPLSIVNPIHETLSYADDRLQGRRDQPKYLALIRAVAFLRQLQKPVRQAQGRPIRTDGRNGESVEYIEVDAEDVTLANRLAHEILGHSLDELSRPSRNLLLELEKMVRERLGDPEDKDEDQGGSLHRVSFTRREIREFTGWSNYRVHIHLKELVEFEYVSVETDRVNNTYRYRLLYDGQGKDGSRFMLGLSAEGGSASGGNAPDAEA
ncbi:MAG: toprim domain-containing protein [Planctomycetes bacterium]|nr:toprim domain-containing protein [Planctomycetota bacterium]